MPPAVRGIEPKTSKWQWDDLDPTTCPLILKWEEVIFLHVGLLLGHKDTISKMATVSAANAIIPLCNKLDRQAGQFSTWIL